MEGYIGENGTLGLMKNRNIEKVFKMIQLHAPISRATISKQSGLNKATVSSCVAVLIENGLVAEQGQEITTGRPSTLLEPKGESGVIMGIEFNVFSLSRILVTDLVGRQLESYTVTHRPDPDVFVDIVVKHAARIRADYAGKRLGLVGIAIAVPGNFNQQSQRVGYMVLPDWIDYPLREKLEPRLHSIPLFLDMTSIVGVLGETHFGRRSTPLDYLVFVNGAWGISVGVYANGNIPMGVSGFSERFGHTIVHANGRLCACGNKGCLQAYISVRSLFERLYPNVDFAEHYLQEIHRQYHQGKENVVEAIDELVYYLGIGLINLISSYNPGKICIGGLLGKLLDSSLLDRVKQHVNDIIPHYFRKNLEIYCSELGEYSIVYGCVASVKENLVSILSHGN